MADYIIGSFNAQNLNLRSDNVQKKDFKKIAEIIEKENFDIVALQETITETAIKQIEKYLPNYWVHDFNQENGRPDIDDEGKTQSKNSAKGFTFLWNSKRFEECSKDNHAQFEPVKGYIVRRPFVGRFAPVNGPFCEIRLINIHLCNPNNCKDKKLQEYASVADLYKRIYSDRTYGNNRSAYTLILGDYNIPLRYCHECEEVQNLSIKTFLGGDDHPDEKTTLITQEKYQEAIDQGIQPFIFANDFDHCSYNERYLKERNIKIEVRRINSVEVYCKNELIEHRKSISDHVPIKIELSLR
jgi:exonuclease III